MVLNRRSRQQGGVLVLVAACTVVLVMFLAYVVDISAALLAEQRAQQFARLAALAAIEGYFSKSCGSNQAAQSCYEDRLRYALARANAVSQENRIFNSIDSPSGKLELALASENSQSKTKLIAGKWIVLEGSNECNGEPPCFVANTSSAQEANAFRVENAFKEGISGFFSRSILGVEALKFKASAVATVVPRHAVFLIDISASTTRETHLKNNVPGQNSQNSDYAFFLPADNGSPPPSCKFNNVTWNAMEDSRGDRPAEPTVHYKSDYQTVTPYVDSNYESDSTLQRYHPNPGDKPKYAVSSCVLNPTFRVDGFRANTYRGPEPLQTILEGLRYVMDIFKERAVSGDTASVIFYDESFSWPRVVLPTSDFDYIQDLLDNTPSSSSNDPFVQAAKHWLFPVPLSKTNSLFALDEAVNQLSQQRVAGVVTSDFIVMIGDGQSNCFPYTDTENIWGSPPTFRPGTTEPIYWKCQNIYESYRRSTDALILYAKERIKPFGIPIHTIVVGEQSGPNTVDLRADTGSPCFTDAEIRSSQNCGEPTFVRGSSAPTGGWTPQAWSQAFNRNEGVFTNVPFYEASKDMYRVACHTRGIYAPIRPRFPNCTPRPCGSSGEMRTEDPLCRDSETQIKDAMRSFFDQNPYAVVDVN
ncbi:MAG: hypothetical protein EBZ48_06665 [Proteobacteria bacterium]|nr:hypothetical protein [Pseudomonadota bacterium]